ncbi:MAG TPA: Mur ligase family protein [Polyangiaceae bacterium]|nr:Mur ligase family protein [Polyangiaceae bacterium]
MKHVHLVGVSGTGMGALATLFRSKNVRVTGADVAFDPPIGPALREAGVECLSGYDASHLDPAPDVVVIGNAIRKDNVEARAAEERDLPRSSMSGALRDHFLRGRRPVVVCGTHGKTTTSSLSAWVLAHAKLEPGFFIGGIPKGFGVGAAIGYAERSLTKKPAPFVVEGDEYDAVYWHKQPKFFDYVGVSADDVVIVTSIEHDHIDIYPTERAYEDAFIGLYERVPEKGLVIVDISQSRALELARTHAKARVVTYGLDPSAEWSGALAADGTFDVFAGGSACGRFSLQLPGAHNVRNALAAIAMAAEGFGVAPSTSKAALASFEGVKRRQELLGEPGGVFVYDDFAHHPTAVDETLRALRKKHPKGSLVAIFEPRSATACRNIHQAAYVGAFEAADRVLLAPLGRTNVPEAERLDLAKLARDLGSKARAATSVDDIVNDVASSAKRGDVIAVLSNGAFGGIHALLTHELEKRGGAEK